MTESCTHLHLEPQSRLSLTVFHNFTVVGCPLGVKSTVTNNSQMHTYKELTEPLTLLQLSNKLRVYNLNLSWLFFPSVTLEENLSYSVFLVFVIEAEGHN